MYYKLIAYDKEEKITICESENIEDIQTAFIDTIKVISKVYTLFFRDRINVDNPLYLEICLEDTQLLNNELTLNQMRFPYLSKESKTSVLEDKNSSAIYLKDKNLHLKHKCGIIQNYSFTTKSLEYLKVAFSEARLVTYKGTNICYNCKKVFKRKKEETPYTIKIKDNGTTQNVGFCTYTCKQQYLKKEVK